MVWPHNKHSYLIASYAMARSNAAVVSIQMQACPVQVVVTDADCILQWYAWNAFLSLTMIICTTPQD